MCETKEGNGRVFQQIKRVGKLIPTLSSLF